MIYYNLDEFELTYCIGSHQYDIEPNEFKRYTDASISDKINTLESAEIIPLLDYQYSQSLFPFAFFQILFGRSSNKNWLKDDEKRKILHNWINDNSPIEKTDLEICFSTFLEADYEQFNEESFEEHIRYHVPEELIKILNFTLKLSNESIELHRKNCTSLNCAYEINYKQKTNYINLLLSKIEERKSEEVNVNRIQWKGTQKQLAELFIELKNNNWIEGFEYETIKACFTNAKSIQQVLKPSQDPKTFEPTYEGVYTKNYSPKFYGITENQKE